MVKKTRQAVSSSSLSLPDAGPSAASSVDKKGKRKDRSDKLESERSVPASVFPRSEQEEPDFLGEDHKQKKRQKDNRPKKRKAERTTGHDSPSSEDMTIEPIFTTSSGDLVHTQNAGLILSQYLQAFHQKPETFAPTYDITLIPPADLADRKWTHDPKNPNQPPPDSLYSCTVTMPPGVPLRSAIAAGPGYRSKRLAKQYASGAMVKKLVDAGQITPNLQPKPTGSAVKDKKIKAKDMKDMEWFDRQQKLKTPFTSPQTKVPDATLNDRWKMFKEGVRDQLPAVPRTKDGRKGLLDVAMITSPNFWKTCPSFEPSKPVYPTLITLDITGDHAELRDMCLLTTLPIPGAQQGLEIDLSVPAESNRGAIKAKATLIAKPKMSKLDTQQLESALAFTRQLLREHMALPYVGRLRVCPWLVLPMKRDLDGFTKEKLKRKDFDWEQVGATIDPQLVPIDSLAVQDLDDKALSELVYTFVKAEVGQRDCVVRKRSDLTAGAPHPDFPKRTVAQHAIYRQDDSPHPAIQHPDQPVWECSPLNPGRHGGYLVELVQNQEVRLVVPELGARHPLSASVYRSTSVLPTLLTRLDDLLIARELSETRFDSAIDPRLALQALTAPMSTVDQSGSYERLEILGDTLLKLIATVDLYIRPSEEGMNDEKAHQRRHLVLSNLGLQNCATKAGIPPYIRHVRHKAKDWKPVGWTVEGQAAETASTGALGVKVIADVAEALIGASYISQNRSIDSAISTARSMQISLQALSKWSDAQNYIHRRLTAQPKASASSDPLLSLLQGSKLNILDYTFQDAERGRSVLSRSRTPEQEHACLRFKLLGDSVLEYFVIQDLWDEYPTAGPQEMTVMKHSRVNEGALSALASTLPLYGQLANIPREEQPRYKNYRKAVLAARSDADDIIQQLGAAPKPALVAANETFSPDEMGQEWWADLDVSPILGEVVDCVLGAILEDSAYNLDVTREVYRKHIAPFYERYCLGPHRESLHPKSQLSQLMGGKRHCQHYSLRHDGLNQSTRQMGASVVLHDQVVGSGSASSQTQAVRRACAEVMKKVKTDPKWVEHYCDCPSKST